MYQKAEINVVGGGKKIKNLQRTGKVSGLKGKNGHNPECKLKPLVQITTKLQFIKVDETLDTTTS